MLANLRLNFQAILVKPTMVLLALALFRQGTLAAEPLTAAQDPWTAMQCSVQSMHAQIRYNARRPYEPNRPSFVITHGMGGTETGDRFHQLGDAICNAIPECNVLLIDWSEQSWRTGWFGFPNPVAVSHNIDPVASEVSALLNALQIDSAQTTFIGESFGNCVNARIAMTVGGRGRILAFNPANDAGGYKTPDLRNCSDVAWSFQTHSMFDTQNSIADLGIFLETSPNATDVDQHIAGVPWLAERVRSGDLAWLLTSHKIIETQSECFDAIGTLSGEILHQKVVRRRPVPDQETHRPAMPLVTMRFSSHSP